MSAFKIIAKNKLCKVVAEYLFASMKEAMKFELHMRDQEYTTEMIRLNLDD